VHAQPNHSGPLSAWLNGLLGVVIFSGSLPATRIAVLEMEPMFLTFLRASIAGVLAIILIIGFGRRRPRAADLPALAIVSLGVVIGFPLLTAMALRQVTSAHSIVYLGLLPLSTALFAVLRGGERPKKAFWIFSLLGSGLVMGFALSRSTFASLHGDLLMLAAILACGLGYAEGARLTRTLGGWQTISWALILSLPAMLVATIMTLPTSLHGIGGSAWLALAYVSVFSMLAGFIFWYQGLAAGGIAAVGQLQLLQPFFGLALSAVLLHESLSPGMVLVTLGVVLCVMASRKFA